MEFSGNNNNSSQNNSGLLRYRSAPTSLLSNLTNLDDQTNSVDVVMENDIDDDDDGDNSCNKGFASMIMNSQLPPQYPRPNVGSNRFVSSIGILDNYEGQGIKNMASALVKQNSSPAGFFSHLNSLNAINFAGYAGARLVGNYRVADGGANGDISTSSSRLRNHMSFGMLSRITEVDHENGRLYGHDEPKVENISVDNLFSTFGSWNNDSSYYAENFTRDVKREMDDNRTLYVNSQDVETGNMSHILSRHLSLPKASSTEIGAIEKLVHFQDTVPCKIRAKRGCATHPRSIAERVRRTRISERMRKLQELIPNMDKQTNTSDMLDFAVEYIKGLQKQYKTLSDIRANCKCSASEKMYLNEAH